MSGSYVDSSAATESADAAAVAQGVVAAVATITAYQADAGRFIAEHGAAVNGGHSPVMPPNVNG